MPTVSTSAPSVYAITYYEVLSRRMVEAVCEFSPRVEWYSIDEFFFEAIPERGSGWPPLASPCRLSTRRPRKPRADESFCYAAGMEGRIIGLYLGLAKVVTFPSGVHQSHVSVCSAPRGAQQVFFLGGPNGKEALRGQPGLRRQQQ
jgi:hypothetical protein